MAELTAELRQCYPATGPIAAYVEWASRLTQAPPVFHLAAITAVVGYELCRRGFRCPPGRHMPRAWFAFVGEPTAGKTSVLSRVRHFTQDFYAYAVPQLEFKPWFNIEGSMSGVLYDLMRRTDPHTGITAGLFWHDEFSSVLRREESLSTFNQIYDGEFEVHYRYLQKAAAAGDANAKSRVDNIWFNGVVTTTHPALSNALKQTGAIEALEGGLYTRFLWLTPPRPTREELMPEELEDAAGRHAVLDTWLSWWQIIERTRHVSRQIAFEERSLRFIRGELYAEFRDAYIAHGGFQGGIAQRVHGFVTVIAAIFAASCGNFSQNALVITYEDAYRAAHLCWQCLQNAIAIGEPLLSDAAPFSRNYTKLINKLEGAAAQGQGVCATEVFRLFSNNLRKGQVEELVELAIAQGLAWRGPGESAGGRPPTLLFSSKIPRR